MLRVLGLRSGVSKEQGNILYKDPLEIIILPDCLPSSSKSRELWKDRCFTKIASCKGVAHGSRINILQHFKGKLVDEYLWAYNPHEVLLCILCSGIYIYIYSHIGIHMLASG